VAHAVWRSPEDMLIDITPMLPVENLPKSVMPLLRDTDRRVFFLPDDKAFEAQPSQYEFSCCKSCNNRAVE
jgi:hypothetical protein